MGNTAQQSEHWTALVNLFRQTKRSNQPVLWAGAGLSMPAGYPSTSELLAQLNTNVPQQIYPFNPTDSTLPTDHYQRSFSHWIQELIDKNTQANVVEQLADIFFNLNTQSTPEQQTLVNLPWAAIYTTNYDTLLEDALDKAQVNSRVFKQEQNLGLERQPELPLYKIHGCISDIRQWTLGQQSYDLYAINHPKLFSQLNQLYFNHPLVYVGCSMLDPRILEDYQSIINNNQQHLLQPAYVIIRKADWQAITTETLHLYQQAKVRPVLFDTFEQLPELIENLKHAVKDDKNSSTKDISEDSNVERLKREEANLDKLLFKQLAPQIATVIANIWLEATPITGFSEHLEENFNVKTAHNADTAFKTIVEPITEICQLLPPVEMNYNDKTQLFNQLTQLFKQKIISRNLFTKAELNPDTLVGLLMANGTNSYDSHLKKALFHLCELLIDGIGALPDWNQDNLLTLVSNEQHLFEKFNESVTRLNEGLSRVEDQQDEIEGTFRREVTRRFNHLRIFGINFGNSVSRYQLEVAYISLLLESETHSKVLDTEQALTGFERLVILGDAGQGKTTLLQWLTVKCSQQTFAEDKTDWNQKVPILLKLREVLKRPKLPQLTDFFELMDDSRPVTEQQQVWIADKVKTKQAIFMVDGFDEVPLERRPETLTWLKQLCQQYAGNYFVLTSRPGAYDEGTLAELSFVEVNLKKMDATAQQQFINHWHRAVAMAEDDTQPTALQTIGEELFEKLQTLPSLRTLAQNPLLCGVVCMLHRQKSGYLPQNKSELYQATCAMFLDNRDRERKVIEEAAFRNLDYTDKCNLLADIAYWMTEQELTSISTTQLLNRITIKLERMPRLRDAINADELHRFFIERSGLLLLVGADEIQFAHRSFQEYFAAYQAVNIEHDWQLLRPNASDEFWHGTIIHAVGLASTSPKSEQFLLQILADAKSNDNEEYSIPLYLLVLTCNDELRVQSPDLEQQIAEILPTIIPPKNAKIRDALTKAGALAMPFLKRTTKRTIKDDTYCAQALAKMHTPEAYRLLPPYFIDTRNSYVEKLFNLWHSLNDEIAQQAQLPQRLKSLAMLQQNWFLLLRLSFIWQDPDLACQAYKFAQEREAIEDFELSITRTDIEQGTKPFSKLPAFTYRREFYFQRCDVKDISFLANFTKLQVINLDGNNIIDIAPLEDLTQLQEIYLNGNNINDIKALTNLTQLKEIYLYGNNISDINALTNLTQLKEIYLYGNNISDINALTNLTQLQVLDLTGNDIEDISPLASLTNLEVLYINCILIKDYSCLKHLKKLNTLGTRNISEEHLRLVRQLLPKKCRVF